jgi:hypothetical protein
LGRQAAVDAGDQGLAFGFGPAIDAVEHQQDRFARLQ